VRQALAGKRLHFVGGGCRSEGSVAICPLLDLLKKDSIQSEFSLA
jgi:hypothetical protein